jgi:hypothetical protein
VCVDRLARFTIAAAALASPAAAAAAPDRAAAPGVHPTLPWLLAQAVPSAEWLVTDGGVRFGGRWQITPLLYSFGIDRRLSPWRVAIAEPIVPIVSARGSMPRFGLMIRRASTIHREAVGGPLLDGIAIGRARRW